MTTVTTSSLRALLENLVDYAGLFPPAKLDMAATVRNYHSYLDNPESWVLNRLIVPVARFAEFEEHAAALLPRGDEDDPWRISALTAPAGDESLEADLETIDAFNERHADPEQGMAVVDVIELRGNESSALDAALDLLPDEIYPFFEMPIDTDPRGLLALLVGCDAGAKVRTGGVTADLYPKPDELARFIIAAAHAGVPFKATAGLHHPLRHHSKAVGAEEFGFLNVFIAAALAWHGRIDKAAASSILVESSPDAFRFDDDGLSWRDQRLTSVEVEDARLAFAVSFGSCSFDEPRDDLRQLGLLDAGGGAA